MKRLGLVSVLAWAFGWGVLLGAAPSASAAEADAKRPYSLTVTAAPKSPTAGTEATYQITVTPTAPWVLKPETPFKAILQATEGIVLSKVKLTSKDFTDPKTASKTTKTTFAAKAKGSQSIKADLTFFLCTDEICQRFKDNAELAVPVK